MRDDDNDGNDDDDITEVVRGDKAVIISQDVKYEGCRDYKCHILILCCMVFYCIYGFVSRIVKER
jgi:hypothetical protein